MSDFLQEYRKLYTKTSRIEDAREALLQANGWKRSCDYPGSFWLWSKSFPESEVQWVWRGKGKVPHPGFTINGATTEIALSIEAAWQDIWVRQPHTPEPSQ